ncbi:hypothetical protein [Nocardiopsis sp. MG754419]|uniref:hypothetical protein n=1 Tax=Nocardiopsis sp. MG754419 TaxID=2259865 RepID=UPI001BA51A5F|nr:hypothetical protein [Nocardiopsis sp. MG754419]MBR8741519.1 hypothetical protein [Nocardiopsis sp. MG754419]
MSRAESGFGRKKRRGGSRRAGGTQTGDHVDDYGREDEEFEQGYDPEEDFSDEYGHHHTRSGADQYDDHDSYDEYGYDGDDHDDRDDDAPNAESTGARRGGRRKGKDKRGVGRVSAFSASAIKKVSVLGDRPNQIVYTLAEQSKRKRGTAVLGVLLGAFSIALVALLGMLSFQLLSGGGGSGGGEDSIVAPPDGHSTLTPEQYRFQANDPEVFGPIDARPADAEPMTEEAVFGSVEELELGDMQLELRDSEITDSCTSLVWGDGLGQSLIDADCTGAASGVYTDGGGDHVAQVTLFDLSDSDAATDVAGALDPTNAETDLGFLLSRTGGDVEGLQDGYSQASTQVMGHYLAVFWSAAADGSSPGEDSDLATLDVASMSAFGFVYDEVVAHRGDEGE